MGTQPVGEVMASRFVADRFGEAAESLEFLGRGEWSSCFAFRHAGTEKVIRFGSHIEDFEKDRIAGSYGNELLPVPQVEEIGDAFGGHYAISERAFGTHLNDLSPEGWQTVLPQLFAVLDQVRGVDLSATEGFGVWNSQGAAPNHSWREFLVSAGEDARGRRIFGWRERLKESPTGDGPFLEALRRLEQLAGSCPEVRYLVHSDLLQSNVLVDRGRITGVLDWGCSLYGDFLYDHAWLAFNAPLFSGTEGIDFVAETKDHFESIGFATDDIEERIRCYQIHIGLDAQAYNAFVGRWADLAAVATRTSRVARS
jgi:hygromycin-B 4-O-kinase